MSGKGCRRMAEISARLCLGVRTRAHIRFVLDDRRAATIIVPRKGRDVHRLSMSDSREIRAYLDSTRSHILRRVNDLTDQVSCERNDKLTE